MLTAVFAILLGFMIASAETLPTNSSKPRIAILGDSMTWIGGDSCRNQTGWTYFLNESGIAGAIDVYARSGATWTNTSFTKRNPEYYTELLHDDNVVYNQAIRLMERADTTGIRPDIIILFAGANDSWFASRRPGIFGTDENIDNYDYKTNPGSVTTLEGSIRLISDILRISFPSATQLFVAPLQMAKSDTQTIHLVSDIIERTANTKGWITLRADHETGITHMQEARNPKFTSDGVHTNPAGARILANYIIRHLQNISTTKPHN